MIRNPILSFLMNHGGQILAIIGYIYYVILMLNFTVFMTNVLLIFVIIMAPLLIIGILHRDKITIIRRVKAVGWGLLIMAFLLFPTFWNVPQQIYIRNNQRQELLEPNSPEVEDLADKFLKENDNLVNMSLEEIGRELKIFGLREIIWELDYVIYGMAAHQATPTEVIKKGTDDCQGQAVVMASILLHLGFEYTWCVEAPFHWWVIVRNESLGELDEGWETKIDELYHDGEIVLINRGGRSELPEWMWADPVLVFNQEELLYPKNPLGSIIASYTTGAYWYRKLVPLFFSLNVLILLIGMFALAFFIGAWTSYQRPGQETKGIKQIKLRKQVFWKKWLIIGLFLFGIMALWATLSLFRLTMDFGLLIAIPCFSITIAFFSEPKFWSLLHIS